MNQQPINIIGLMSGTSLDGLDLAWITFTPGATGWDFTIKATQGIGYDKALRAQLEDAIKLSGDALLAFHVSYGHWLGTQVRHFVADTGAKPDAVASHGHTIHHRPDLGFTFQLGCPQHVALACGIPVVGDFRSLDVALGGQGAPLVPIGDRLLFHQFDFCLNLGGISNISFEQDGTRMAFDIGIANMLLNCLSKQAGMEYDKGGAMARNGQIIPGLLEEINALPYYQKPFPKSTGYEWFKAEILPVFQRFGGIPEDQLRTAVEHISGQIVNQVLALKSTNRPSVLVTGGGACNTFLIDSLKVKGGNQILWDVPEPELIHFKEALIFALLGALRLTNRINVLASVTGARRDSCSGILYQP